MKILEAILWIALVGTAATFIVIYRLRWNQSKTLHQQEENTIPENEEVALFDLREIITNWLKALGYHGLFNSYFGCSCELDDLMPCGGLSHDTPCSAFYKTECDCDKIHDSHISTTKPTTQGAPHGPK